MSDMPCPFEFPLRRRLIDRKKGEYPLRAYVQRRGGCTLFAHPENLMVSAVVQCFRFMGLVEERDAARVATLSVLISTPSAPPGTCFHVSRGNTEHVARQQEETPQTTIGYGLHCADRKAIFRGRVASRHRPQEA